MENTNQISVNAPVVVSIPAIKMRDAYYTHKGMPIKNDHYTKTVNSRDDLLPSETMALYAKIQELTVEANKLKSLLSSDRTNKTFLCDKDMMEVIIDIISERMRVRKEVLSRPTRKREVVICRMLCMTVIRNKTELTFKQIGRRFNRDHSTVIKAVETIMTLVEASGTIREDVNQFMQLDYLNPNAGAVAVIQEQHNRIIPMPVNQLQLEAI